MHLFSPSIKPGNCSQFAAPSYGKICQNDTQGSFLFFSLVLCASSHCPSGCQRRQFQSREMYGEISACQVLRLEEYFLDCGFSPSQFRLVVLGLFYMLTNALSTFSSLVCISTLHPNLLSVMFFMYVGYMVFALFVTPWAGYTQLPRLHFPDVQ